MRKNTNTPGQRDDLLALAIVAAWDRPARTGESSVKAMMHQSISLRETIYWPILFFKAGLTDY